MNRFMLIQMLFVLLCITALTLVLLIGNRRKRARSCDARQMSRMAALIQSAVLIGISALLAFALVGTVDTESLQSNLPDASNVILRQAKMTNLLCFGGLTILFTLVLGALIYDLTVREGPIRKLMRNVNMRQKQVSFGKDASQALKGIAIILMLIHHLFCFGRPDAYTISFFPFTKTQIVEFATFSKICVSLFALISGYGLFLSYRNKKNSDPQWVALRYLKTYSGYWFVFVLCVVVLQILTGRPVAKYYNGNLWTSALSVVIDFLGLAHLFGTSTLLETWWYMSTAFVFILLMPLVCRKQGNYLILWLIGVAVFIRLITGGNISKYYSEYLGGSNPYIFIASFLIGALFARRDLLLRIVNAPYRPIRFVVECVLLVLAYQLYKFAPKQYYWELKWALIPALVLLFSAEFIIRIPGLRRILQFLGHHSMNIYLTHNFFRAYLQDYIYGQKHFALIILLLIGISLICSLIIEALKKVLKYDESISRLCMRIEKNAEEPGSSC